MRSTDSSWTGRRQLADDVVVLDATVAADRERWLTQWNDWPDREVGAHPSYVEAFTAAGESPLCAVLVADGGAVLFPFILRPIDGSSGSLWDVTSAYGYGGAYMWGVEASATASVFWPAFDRWALDRGVVSEFIRFGLFADALLPYPGTRRERQTNIIVPLEPDDESIWMSFDHKVRKNVKKAERSGVTIEVDESGCRLDEFLEIYMGTMDRREARSSYYFPREFFETLNHGLAGNLVYFFAVHLGRVISAELVLVSAHSVYSFLGGTEGESFALRPNDLLKYHVIKWAKRRGKKHFVLGGGATPGDGIERYKRAFAPTGDVPFETGERIIDAESYGQLAQRRRELLESQLVEWSTVSDFFPQYRAAP
jgi:hypothetical protein